MLLAICIFQPKVRAHPIAIITGAAQSSGVDLLYNSVWVNPGLARVRVTTIKLQLKTEFPTSVEIVDDITGKTTALSSKPKEIVVVGSK